MSKENLVKLLEAAAADETLMQQLQQAESYEEVKNLAQEQGFDLGDLSAKQATRTAGVVTGEISQELSGDELELVAGGFNIGMPPTLNFNIGMPPTLKKGIAAQGSDGGI